MLIINQAGDEMFVLENLISIKVMKQTCNGTEFWYVNANVPEYDNYVKLGNYKDEESAVSAFRNIYMMYNWNEKTMSMDAEINGD